MDSSFNLKIVKFSEEYRKETLSCVVKCFGSGESWDHECDYFRGDRLTDDLLTSYVTNKNMVVFLLLDVNENKVIGTIQLTLFEKFDWIKSLDEAIKDTGLLYISLVSVLPEFQSKGLGKYLMNFIENYSYTCKLYALTEDKNSEKLIEHQEKVKKFNFDMNFHTDDFIINNTEYLKKVKKISVQFIETRKDIYKFYDKLGFKYSGHYLNSRDCVYPLEILKDFRWIINWKDMEIESDTVSEK